jgi:prepilin-type processing-associated H-X9-DG protein
MKGLLLCLLFALSCGSMAQSPESVVQSFVDAWNKKDFQAASKLVKGGSVPPYLKGVLESTKQIPTLSLSDVVTTVVGDRALVTFKLKALEPKGLPAMDEWLVLVRAGDGWLIDVPVKDGGLGEMAYFMSNPPVFVQAHASAQQAKCMSNEKRIAVALIMFATDYDDTLKLTAANWQKKIASYVKDTTAFTCPEDKAGSTSYSLNANIVGKVLTYLEDPSRTVLVYEGKDGKLIFRHGGKAMVGFADGHVTAVTPETAKNLLWK